MRVPPTPSYPDHTFPSATDAGPAEVRVGHFEGSPYVSLSERNRSIIFQGLIQTIDDEEAVSEMLSNFPVQHDDELVTEKLLRRELTGLELRLRTEMMESQTAMEIRIVDRIDARTSAAIDGVEQRLFAKIDGVEQHLGTKVDGV